MSIEGLCHLLLKSLTWINTWTCWLGFRVREKHKCVKEEKFHSKICYSRSFTQKCRGLSWLKPFKTNASGICFVIMSYGLLACIYFHIYNLEIVMSKLAVASWVAYTQLTINLALIPSLEWDHEPDSVMPSIQSSLTMVFFSSGDRQCRHGRCRRRQAQREWEVEWLGGKSDISVAPVFRSEEAPFLIQLFSLPGLSLKRSLLCVTLSDCWPC